MIPYRKFSDIQWGEFEASPPPNPPKAPKVCDEGANDARTLDGLGALAASCPELQNERGHSLVADDRVGKNAGVRESGAKVAKPPKDRTGRSLTGTSEAAPACVVGSRADWNAEDWRARFDERAGFLEHDCGLLRVEAEVQAFDHCIVEWLNANPVQSLGGRCAWCGKVETRSIKVVPFGAGEHHAWLHAYCWPAWHHSRRTEAAAALTMMGIALRGSFGEHDD